MESNAINSIRAAVDTALDAHASTLSHSYNVAPEQYEAGTSYITIGLRDISSLVIASVTETVFSYEDLATLELTFYAPRGDGDAVLRAIIDKVKKDLQNSTAGTVSIDDAEVLDVPLDSEDSEIAVYLGFKVRDYPEK